MPRPQEVETRLQGQDRAGSPSTSKRIATATLIRAVGEMVAKTASVALFIAIARELGETGFGDFVFGLSLSSVLFTAAGFGTDELIAREIARRRERVNDLYANILAVKSVVLVALMALMAAIVFAGNYSPTTRAAVMLIALGVAFEVLGKTFHAIFQGYEQMQFIAGSLIIQRTAVALAGIAVLLSGGGLVEVSLIFCLGGLLGLLSSLMWMYRFVVRPRFDVKRSRWVALARAGVPLGLASTLYYALLRLDASLLSFLNGGDNAEVGQYGAAFRLIEATMFVSWAFGGAIMPWLSRHGAQASVSLSRGYELGLKALVAMLVPIAAFFAVYAEPLIELLYGDGYADAVMPLRLLAGMTVLFGINTFLAILMISRDEPGEFARAAGVVIIQNVIFNFILIPPLGAEGAAINAIVSGALLAGWTLRRARRLFGTIAITRVVIAPVLASAALIGVAIATGTALTVIHVIAVAAVYLVCLLAVERVIFPGDFRFYAGLRRIRSSA